VRQAIIRRGPEAVVVPATALTGAVGTLFLGSAQTVLVGTVVGAAWGFLLALAARRLQGDGHALPRYANAAMFAAVIGAGYLAGGGLLDQMLTAAGLASREAILTLYHPPFDASINLFIITANSLMEYVLLPAALLLNWDVRGRRVPLLIAAVAFYAMRVWTYAYFVPNIFEFAALSAEGPYPAAVIERFTSWVNLSWLRAPIDSGVFVLLTLAALRPARVADFDARPNTRTSTAAPRS
jgi:hypothetical protein